LNTDCPISLKDDLVDLSVALEEEVSLVSHGAVNVSVGRITAAAGITIDPFQPVLCPMGGIKVLEVVGDGDTLRFSSPEEILGHWVRVVAE
jgi:hypothetical protein